MSIKLVIDPGAAETYAAVIVGEKSELVRLGKYQYGIPTAVCLTPDDVLHFGEAAEKMAEVHPAGYCRAFVRKLGSSAKLLMGRYTAADLLGKFLAYVFPLVKERCGCAAEGAVDVVLCCPVSRTPNQQSELREAALKAGARTVELVTDTGAIYCVWADRLRSRGFAPLYEKNALLVNWSPARVEYAHMVAEAAGGKINPRAVGGQVELGGEEIYEDLANYIMAKVARMRPVGRVAWPALLRQVREQCPVRDAQRALSTQQLNVRSFLIAGHSVEVQIPGVDYARLLAPYLERMASAVKSLYMSALRYGKPEVVLITGDLALLPGAQKILAETLGKPVYYRTKPTDAVEGAALYLKQNGALSMSQQAQQPAPQPKVQPVALPVENPVEKPAEKPAEQPAEKTAEKPAEKPVEKPVDAQSALWEALHAQDAAALSSALALPGVDVAAADSVGNTPLHIVAGTGAAALLPCLLNGGSELESRNDYGWTPLQAAVVAGHLDCAESLVAHGADVNVCNESGYSLLHTAAEDGNVALLKLLLKSPAVNANVLWDFDGSTPLHVAAAAGHAEVVRLLLAVPGIDTTVQDILGQTAAELAAENGHAECSTLFADL